MPSFNEAMRGEFSEQYAENMKKDISTPIHQNTRITVPHSEADKCHNAYPDGTQSKFARFCVRGDLQKKCIDYLETIGLLFGFSH